MDKTDIRIPTDEELTAYMEESAVSANGAYEQSPVVLMVDDAAIGTLGNFSASIGKAKSKKTFNVTAIAASALKYLFKEYTTSEVVISASIKLTIRMDRTELVMGQEPAVELCEIEYGDLQEAIDGETEY